jgi:(2Fe-2S) ferredoxin
MRAHNRHVLMCVGPRCTEDGTKAQSMFEQLGEKIDALPDLRVKRTRTHCMVACRNQGPLMVIYPEGVWYRCVDTQSLDRIVTEHLVGGCEVADLIFHRLGDGDTELATNEGAQ